MGQRKRELAVPGERVDQAVERAQSLSVENQPATVDPRLVVAFEKWPSEDGRGNDGIAVAGQTQSPKCDLRDLPALLQSGRLHPGALLEHKGSPSR